MQNLAELEQGLSQPTKQGRLSALQKLMDAYNNGSFEKPTVTEYVNNHIHTIYSFSPYSPASAAYHAWKNGLCTAGIMDHDSISGAEEFIQAGKIIGIATTIGVECRCKMDKTPFNGKRINNPDQNSVAYLAAHGIPHQNIEKLSKWLEPYREKRNQRNRLMVKNINQIVNPAGIELDFERDVLPLSQSAEGGSVTERHILYALSNVIVAKIGRGQAVLDYLKSLGIEPAGNNLKLLKDAQNPMYEYYLLGVLKGSMVEQFYIEASEECPDVHDFIAFIKEIGGISAYAYLGDVGDSVTGDKKTQSFEDSYLDELVAWLAEAGFNAITYMPTRNTKQQLERVINLCAKHNLFEISGEDINTPFQSFICKALDEDMFKHLVTSTWALIGHELEASKDQSLGMFSAESISKMPALKARIEYFKDKSANNK